MNTTPKRPYCLYDLSQVRQSNLLPAERMSELDATIESRISKCFDEKGQEVTNARIADLGDGRRLMYTRLDHDHDYTYMRREIMNALLTVDEIALLNRRCTSAISAAQDAKRFAAAEKLTEWDGWVFDCDDYHESIEAYIERHFEDADGEEEIVYWSEYVWVCKCVPVVNGLDAARVCERFIDDNGWEDMDLHDLNGVEDLEKALAQFEKANECVVTYQPDYSKAILIADYVRAAEAFRAAHDSV